MLAGLGRLKATPSAGLGIQLAKKDDFVAVRLTLEASCEPAPKFGAP